MNTRRDNKVKGFTLVELIVVITIIGVLSMLLVPSMIGLIRKARIQAAISDARTIKTTIETSLLDRFQFDDNWDFNADKAFNKMIEVQKDDGSIDTVNVGCFTNFTWYMYKNKELSDRDGSAQKVDHAIAAGLDKRFSEDWKKGKKVNPLTCNSDTKNCKSYLANNNTNFGLVVVYDDSFNVRMMQVYRKGILVTFIEGEYIANTSSTAHFVGVGKWNTIYEDAGKVSSERYHKIHLLNKQKNDKGQIGNWYNC